MTTFPESHQDLLKAEVATLATIGQDGYPQESKQCFKIWIQAAYIPMPVTHKPIQ
jgi:hypothetical protein